MDEATSALDPISTQKTEELMVELKKNYTVIIVTHNMQQAARVADKTAFFFMGDLIEYGKTEQILKIHRGRKQKHMSADSLVDIFHRTTCVKK